MKPKVFISLIVSVGLSLLVLTVTAQGIEEAGTNGTTTHVDWANPGLAAFQKWANLDYTSAITFTPVATIYLPIALKNHDPLLVYFDDFSNPGSGWYIDEWPGEIKWSYQNGEYEILLYNAYWWGGALSPAGGLTSYSVEADMRCHIGSTTCGYGLIFGLVDWGHFYVFIVDPGYREYSIWRYAYPNWVKLVDWTSSPHINPLGATNHLMVVRNGGYIAAYVNRQFLATANDSTYMGSLGTGLYAESYENAPVAVRYDNFKIRRLATTMGINETLLSINVKPVGTGSGSIKEP